jgi:hypothetical protein
MSKRKPAMSIISEGREYHIRNFSWSHPSKRRPSPGRYTTGIAHRLRYVQITPMLSHAGDVCRTATILTARLKRPTILSLTDVFARLETGPFGPLMLSKWPGAKAVLATDVRAGKVHFILQEPRLYRCSASDDHRHVMTRLSEWDFVMRTSLGDLIEQGEIDFSASFAPLIIRRPSFTVDYAWLTPATKLYR